jgi:hypothetical protein
LFFKPEKRPAVKKKILNTISNFNNLSLTVTPDNVPIDISSTTNNNQTVVKSLWVFYSDIAISSTRLGLVGRVPGTPLISNNVS